MGRREACTLPGDIPLEPSRTPWPAPCVSSPRPRRTPRGTRRHASTPEGARRVARRSVRVSVSSRNTKLPSRSRGVGTTEDSRTEGGGRVPASTYARGVNFRDGVLAHVRRRPRGQLRGGWGGHRRRLWCRAIGCSGDCVLAVFLLGRGEGERAGFRTMAFLVQPTGSGKSGGLNSGERRVDRRPKVRQTVGINQQEAAN